MRTNKVIDLGSVRREEKGKCEGCHKSLTKEFFWIRVIGREEPQVICSNCRNLLKRPREEFEKLKEDFYNSSQEINVQIRSIPIEKAKQRARKRNKK